jgi:hypothetical protein
MILSFKKQFVDRILDGTKIHTIREDKHGKWKSGNWINFATGVRTPYYDQFKFGVCFNVQDISIFWGNQEPRKPAVFLSNINKLPVDEILNIFFISGECGKDQMEQLAKNDGFDSVDDFFEWFNTDFEGKIIHWTDFKYE